MEFFLITIALFGGFFKGTLKKVSGLDFSDAGSLNMKASLSLQDARNKISAPAPLELPPSLQYPISNIYSLPVKISDAPEPEIKAASAIAMDMETDKIMFAKNAGEQMPVASISKIFTALTVYDIINKDKIIKITRKAVETEALAGGLKEGEEFRAGDLVDLMLISSSNDAAVQFALNLAGSSENFTGLMNKKAESFGLKKTRFADPAGLGDQNISTAFEIAQIADATFGKSSIWDILKEKEADIYSLGGTAHHLKNTNDIIGEEYIIAGKTGYTAKAKGALVVIADSGQNDRKIISVVLGSDDRFEDTRVLVEWARKEFKW